MTSDDQGIISKLKGVMLAGHGGKDGVRSTECGVTEYGVTEYGVTEYGVTEYGVTEYGVKTEYGVRSLSVKCSPRRGGDF